MADNKRVLLVEDNDINAFVVKKFLQDHTVFHAKSGTSAMEILEKEPVDVVFMDINLGNPEFDGVEVLRRIRKDPKIKDTKVIAVTSYALKGDREKFLEDGFDEYVAKPLDRDNLLKLVSKFGST